MSELQFVRVEGDYLVMKSPDGVEFQLPVDDVLRGELRQSSAPKRTSSTISPREIQEAIREGASIEELVEKHDADYAYIEKFAQPVIDELAHVVATAKAVRINLAGDRFSDVTQIEFGDLISRRLAATGAKDATWTSHRQDQSTWLVTVRFELPQGRGHATWSFDPRKLTLAPENESALSLSSAESISEGPIPRLRPVTTDQSRHPAAGSGSTGVIPKTETPPAQKTNVSSLSDTQKVNLSALPTEVIETPPSRSTIREAIARATDAADSAGTAEAGSVTENFAHGSNSMPVTDKTVDKAESIQDEVVPDPADLLDALRRKRLERETAAADELPHKAPGAARPLIPVSEPEPVTSSIRIINDEPLVEAEASQLPATEPEDLPSEPAASTSPIEVVPDVAAPKPEPKKGRPGIPSWDEIVFGTKTDD